MYTFKENLYKITLGIKLNLKILNVMKCENVL